MNISPVPLSKFGKKAGGVTAYFAGLFGGLLILTTAFVVTTVVQAQASVPTSAFLAYLTPRVWLVGYLSAAGIITLLHFKPRFALAVICLGTAGVLATLAFILAVAAYIASLL